MKEPTGKVPEQEVPGLHAMPTDENNIVSCTISEIIPNRQQDVRNEIFLAGLVIPDFPHQKKYVKIFAFKFFVYIFV